MHDQVQQPFFALLLNGEILSEAKAKHSCPEALFEYLQTFQSQQNW